MRAARFARARDPPQLVNFTQHLMPGMRCIRQKVSEFFLTHQYRTINLMFRERPKKANTKPTCL